MAVEEVELHGPAAASAYLARLEDQTHLQACLFDATGNVLAGDNCAAFSETTSRLSATHTSEVSRRRGGTHIAVRLPGNNGAVYVYATSVRAGPPISRAAIVRQWCIALLVSGLICYLLTRYLTAPILRLREASQHLAAGELSTRAAADMERRRDELGSLVRDFNTMADRIEQLISRQRQLISDVSHELRSPLARLTQRPAIASLAAPDFALRCETASRRVQLLHSPIGDDPPGATAWSRSGQHWWRWSCRLCRRYSRLVRQPAEPWSCRRTTR